MSATDIDNRNMSEISGYQEDAIQALRRRLAEWEELRVDTAVHCLCGRVFPVGPEQCKCGERTLFNLGQSILPEELRHELGLAREIIAPERKPDPWLRLGVEGTE